jgi:hypothetical protein
MPKTTSKQIVILITLMALIAVCVGTLSTYSPVSADDNPGPTNIVGCWSMDETSGTREDASLNNYDLTDNNTVGYNTGKVGNAADFVAANAERLSINDNVAMSGGDVDFYWAGWVYVSGNTGAFQTILAKASGAAYEYEFYIPGNPPSALKFYKEPNTVIATGGNLSATTWYFVEAKHDAINNTIGVAINNGSWTTASTATGISDTTGALWVGGDPKAAAGYWQGRIDELIMYRGRILTDAERTWLYNSGNGRACSTVVEPPPPATATPTNTATITDTPTVTSTPTATYTPTDTATPTATITDTPTSTSTTTDTPTATSTATETSTPTDTATPTATGLACNGFTSFFEDDFETGDTSKWAYTYGSSSAQGDIVYAGDYAAQIMDGGSLRNDTLAGESIVVLQFYVQFTDFEEQIRIIRLVEDAVEMRATANTDGTLTIQGPSASATSYEALDTDTWYKIDVRVDFSGSPLVIDWQIDGVEQPQYTDNETGGAFEIFDAGILNDAGTTIYMDDIKLSTDPDEYPICVIPSTPVSPISTQVTAGDYAVVVAVSALCLVILIVALIAGYMSIQNRRRRGL